MTGDARTETLTDGSARADAGRAAVRPGLVASLGIALVVVLDAVVRSTTFSSLLVLGGYSLLIWAVVPAVLTIAVLALGAGLARQPLPRWVPAAVAGLALAAWTAWGVAGGDGARDGVVTGLGAAGAALVLAAPWRLSIRLAVAVGVATAAVAVLALLRL